MNEDGTPAGKVVRIGGACGFWGDSSVGAPQLVASGQVDYLVFDYLAELTMSILAGARLKNPELGYATDFVEVAMKSVLRDVVAKGIRVVSNAGGVNPQACAAALAALATEQGLELKIAVVTGDDVMPLLAQLRESGQVREMQGGAMLPDQVLTANAYLGALPVKAALDAGAQVVVTGRCVDSAVTLGVLMHEFGWGSDELDRLAGGSLAGHILECGCQATGGLHTDWDTVPGWADIGYPVAECRADGSFVVTKPAGTGGKVTPAVVAEQMLYEIGDPAAYLLPDVICDFTQVTMLQAGAHRVQVRGARGRAPSASYKVCATHVEGFKTSAQLTIVGFDAVAKARRTGAAIIDRTSALLSRAGLAPYTATRVEVLGAESCYGPHATALQTREAVLRVTATHASREALALFTREVAPAGTSWAPGTTGAGARAAVSPSIRQYAFLLDKARLAPEVTMDGRPVAVPPQPHSAESPQSTERFQSHQPIQSPQPAESAESIERAEWAGAIAPPTRAERSPENEATNGSASSVAASDTVEVPLIRLAYGRSGDKGDTSNIGIIAREPRLVPVLRAQLSEAAVAAWLAHLVKGTVTRFEVPGVHAFNFVCTQALDGGGMASMRNDALGKGMAQILLAMPVRLPIALLPGN